MIGLKRNNMSGKNNWLDRIITKSAHEMTLKYRQIHTLSFNIKLLMLTIFLIFIEKADDRQQNT